MLLFIVESRHSFREKILKETFSLLMDGYWSLLDSVLLSMAWHLTGTMSLNTTYRVSNSVSLDGSITLYLYS